MRNLLVDLMAGVLITISAVYDFGTPECFAFIAFSVLVIIGEIYGIYKVKHGDYNHALAYRSKSADWYDLFLGIIMITSYAEWLGVKSLWFYIAASLCIVVSINAIYNLLQRRNDKSEGAKQKDNLDSKQNWLKILADIC